MAKNENISHSLHYHHVGRCTSTQFCLWHHKHALSDGHDRPICLADSLKTSLKMTSVVSSKLYPFNGRTKNSSSTFFQIVSTISIQEAGHIAAFVEQSNWLAVSSSARIEYNITRQKSIYIKGRGFAPIFNQQGSGQGFLSFEDSVIFMVN